MPAVSSIPALQPHQLRDLLADMKGALHIIEDESENPAYAGILLRRAVEQLEAIHEGHKVA